MPKGKKKERNTLHVPVYLICSTVNEFFFQEFFENPAFRADGLKIYPTLVIRGTGMTSFLFIHNKML